MKKISFKIIATTFLISSLFAHSVALAQDSESAEKKELTPEEIEEIKRQGTSDPNNTHAFAFELFYQNAIKPTEILIEAKPGDTFTKKVVAKNKSPLSLNYKFYAVDGSQDTTGNFAFAASTAEKKEVGTWINVKMAEKKMSPQETIDFPIEIKIPENAELNKTYEGGLLMHREADKDPTNDFLLISTRIGKKATIKTTEHPFEIPKQAYVYNHSTIAKFSIPYFWISLGLFVFSIILLGVSNLKKNN